MEPLRLYAMVPENDRTQEGRPGLGNFVFSNAIAGGPKLQRATEPLAGAALFSLFLGLPLGPGGRIFWSFARQVLPGLRLRSRELPLGGFLAVVLRPRAIEVHQSLSLGTSLHAYLSNDIRASRCSKI